MPFLHGFRRIVYEYQPLVDAVMHVLGLEEGGGEGGGDGDGDGEEDQEENRVTSAEQQSAVSRSLEELLERESQSEVFLEGISYALFKVAEKGLVYAAEILIRYGAQLNFENPVSYYNPLHIAVQQNKPNMVRLLVEHGADIEKRDRIHGSSPLDLASEESERLPCLLTLLDLGADVNAHAQGKTALLHAMISSDGVTVDTSDNIQLLLQRGADMNAATMEGESLQSLLVFLVEEARDSSAEDAAAIGNFCLKTARMLLAHGFDPSCCLSEYDELCLMETTLGQFDLLFPLAVLLIQSGARFDCGYHDYICWSGDDLIYTRLREALLHCPDQSHASELLEHAEVLLDLARVNVPRQKLPLNWELPVPGQDPHPYAQALADLQSRALERKASPSSLRCLCRAFIRTHLRPWPLEERVRALPLPDRLKDFLLPECSYTPKPGWDRFKTLKSEDRDADS